MIIRKQLMGTIMKKDGANVSMKKIGWGYYLYLS